MKKKFQSYNMENLITKKMSQLASNPVYVDVCLLPPVIRFGLS